MCGLEGQAISASLRDEEVSSLPGHFLGSRAPCQKCLTTLTLSNKEIFHEID